MSTFLLPELYKLKTQLYVNTCNAVSLAIIFAKLRKIIIIKSPEEQRYGARKLGGWGVICQSSRPLMYQRNRIFGTAFNLQQILQKRYG